MLGEFQHLQHFVLMAWETTLALIYQSCDNSRQFTQTDPQAWWDTLAWCGSSLSTPALEKHLFLNHLVSLALMVTFTSRVIRYSSWVCSLRIINLPRLWISVDMNSRYQTSNSTQRDNQQRHQAEPFYVLQKLLLLVTIVTELAPNLCLVFMNKTHSHLPTL